MTGISLRIGSILRGWRGPPLAFQILGLLIGGLVVAQLVTLFLTMVLPPAPPSQYGLGDIAGVLRGQEQAGGGRGLQRRLQAGPPDLSGPGWLVSERSRHELASLLRADDADVSLSFYTPLPFAGTALRRPVAMMADDGPMMGPMLAPATFDGTTPARFILARAQGGLPSTFPPGQLPTLPQGRLGEPGNFVLPRNALPPADMAGPLPRAEGAFGRRALPGSGNIPPLPRPGSLYGIDPRPLGSDIYIPGDGGAAIPPLLQGPTAGTAVQPTLPVGATPRPGAGLPPPVGVFGGQDIPPPLLREPGEIDGFRGTSSFRDLPAQSPLPALAPPAMLRAAPVAPERGAPTAPPPAITPFFEPTLPATPFLAPVPAIATPPQTPAVDRPVPAGLPIAVTPPSRGLFGFAPAPFVEGDFVAALRLPDGRWSIVQPADEPFPNAWQRRLLLWFAVAFAIVAPLGWLFARRLVKPLAGFAIAAERLGRDPAGAVIALDGPAEMGRAARAFNLMQGRLRSFVDDRTAMVGAISHDLRTPLTRLRFRIEDVPDDLREGMLSEVAEMEEMISSVLEFIRDASTPNIRERLDLRTLVDDVVEDALMIGNDVTVEQGGSATVEVDVLGMRRVLDNLLENAVKYGARARVRLRTEPDAAVAEIFDDGPGLPDDELERVFEPFYRSEAARASDTRGSGLGLAVCRSITRAHGGDVRLLRSAEGFMAQLRVPLAYGSVRPLAA